LRAAERSQDVARVAEPVTYEDVVSICDAHGIGLPVDCIEMVVEIIGHACAPQPPQAGASRDDWQQKALDHGFQYWRAPDAHGVTGTVSQAVELLQDLLGVEVEIKDAPAAPAVAPIYQIMCTDDDDAEEHPHVRDLWMDVPKDAFDKLAKRGDMRTRAVYAAPAPAEPKGEQQDDYEAKGTIDHLDLDNHRLRRAMQKIMARLAELLDEDQFANIESIVKGVGVEPPEQRAGTLSPTSNYRLTFILHGLDASTNPADHDLARELRALLAAHNGGKHE
jgi:hypothetical protein